MSDGRPAGDDPGVGPASAAPTRVALVVESMPAGGLEAFVLRLGQGLREAGMDVTVVVVRERGDWFPRIAEAGLRVLELGGEWRGPSLLDRVRHAVAVGRRLAAERFDVLFVNHVAAVQAVLGRLPRSTAVVPILHNDARFVFDVGCANRDAWNVTVAVGPGVRRGAEQRVGAGAVREIQYGVEIPGDDHLARRAAWAVPLRIVVAGRVEHGQKGVLHVPDVARSLLDRGVPVRITVLGDGPDRPRLEQAVAARGVAGNVELRGAVEHAVVLEELLGAHVLLMPSYYEGLPNVLLEAQACGCVPVASLLPGVTDAAVRPDETGLLVPPGDVTALADAVAALAGDAERWAALSRRGMERARSRFSTTRMVAEYRELIGDLVAGRHPRPASASFGLPLNLRLLPWQNSAPRWLVGALRRVRRSAAA